MRKGDNLPPYCAVSLNLGTLTSQNPLGLFRPVTGQLYLLLTEIREHSRKEKCYFSDFCNCTSKIQMHSTRSFLKSVRSYIERHQAEVLVLVQCSPSIISS